MIISITFPSIITETLSHKTYHDKVAIESRIFVVECYLSYSSYTLSFVAWTFGLEWFKAIVYKLTWRHQYSSISTSNHVFQNINTKESYPYPIMLNHWSIHETHSNISYIQCSSMIIVLPSWCFIREDGDSNKNKKFRK